MNNSDLNFDKFIQEADKYIKDLAAELGYPEEKQRTLIIWRAVMHNIRDRIQIAESFDLMSQLPMLLKGIYSEGWKYHDKPPMDFDTIEEMKNEVKRLQQSYGETEFAWKNPTEEIIATVIDSLRTYVTEGQLEHIRKQLPEDLKALAD